MLLLGSAADAGSVAAGAKPHILFILQDDLGHYDVGFNGNTESGKTVTGNISALAVDGIVLRSHCEPPQLPSCCDCRCVGHIYIHRERGVQPQCTELLPSNGLCPGGLKPDTHWHCSPTRRSFLSGRLPIHHHEQLSGTSTDDIDLRWTWVSAKLKSAGYRCFW